MLKIIAVFLKLYFISLKYAFQKKEIQTSVNYVVFTHKTF